MPIFKNLFSKVTPKVKRYFSLVGLDGSPVSWDTHRYLRAYEISAYVYGAVRKRAEKVSEIEFTLANSRSGKQIEDSPFLDLLYKPNPYQNKNEFLQLFQIYKDLTGEAYIYKLRVGNIIKELHLLRPDLLDKINFAEDGSIASYDFKIESVDGNASGNKKTYAAQDIISSVYPNPLNKFRGLSPLKAGALAVDTENQLSLYHNKVIQNGGKIEGILSFEGEMTPDQEEEVRKKFKKKFADPDKSGEPLIATGGLTYTNMGLTPTELSYLESKKMTRDDILLIYGVPKAIVAQTDDVNYASAKEAKSIFLAETIRPLLVDLVEKFNEFLIPDGMELGFIDPTPADIDAISKRIDSGANHYYMTLNEMRNEANLEPDPNGDVYLVPFNLMAVSDLSALEDNTPPTPVIVPPAADPKVPVDPNAPADPNADPNNPDNQKRVKKNFKHPLKDANRRKVYHAEYIKRFAKQERELLKAVRAIIRGQKARTLDRLDDLPNYKSFTKKSLIDDYFSLNIEIKLAKDRLLPFLEKFAREAGEKSFKLFNQSKPYLLSAQIKSTLERRADLFAKTTTETTFNQLSNAFENSIQNNETRQELAKRVSGVFDDISAGRAMTIATTETAVANQTGNFDSYSKAGVPIKIWVAIEDDRTRESHSEIDGEEVLLNVPFSNGLMFPCDPAGDADEVINCRCTI